MADQGKVRVIPADELRVRFRALRDDAQLRGWSFLVSYNGAEPAVALLPPGVWLEGCGRVPAAEVQELSARESRPMLAKITEAAQLRGLHSVVTKQKTPTAVLVPVSWVRAALPELLAGSGSDEAGRSA